MAILVTGGAGYIGSHTCVELLDSGEDIVILDNFSNSKPEMVERIRELGGGDFPVDNADILDFDALCGLFAQRNIEAVIHFAGLKAVGDSVRDPLEYYRNNVAGSLCLFRAMDQAGCKKIVFSSSATVYGAGAEVPFREDFPLSATNPYGMTKLVIEQILRDLCVSDPDWSVSLLRYFNPIGAHKSGRIGEDPNGIPNNLLPYIARVAVGKLDCLRVFGDDYDTPDGTGVRDYLHVVDLAEGHLRALDYLRGHKGCEAVNLGTGRGYSVLEVVRAFEQASGVPIPYVISPRRPGDISVSYADPSKAKRLLGWAATRDIDEMCADAWNFTKRQAL